MTALQEGIIRTLSYKLHSGDTYTAPDPTKCRCRKFCPECLEGGVGVTETAAWQDSGWSEELRIDAYEEAVEVLEDVRDLLKISAVSFLVVSDSSCGG